MAKVGAELPFTKMQAIGNDFVLVEEELWPAETDWSQTALSLCDRHTGIGADGLIIVGPSRSADARMRFYNADGTLDMCGNGLTCSALYLCCRDALPHVFDENTPGNSVGYSSSEVGDIETYAGIYRVAVSGRLADEKRYYSPNILIDMGGPRFLPAHIPMHVDIDTYLEPPKAPILGCVLDLGEVGKYRVSVVNVGSPNAVIWGDTLPDDDLFLTVSPLVEVFPERTSVIWAIADGEECLHLRIWKRGVGETLGCANAAWAAAVLADLEHKIMDEDLRDTWVVTVHSWGGELLVGWNSYGDGHVRFFSKAQIVYSGFWNA